MVKVGSYPAGHAECSPQWLREGQLRPAASRSRGPASEIQVDHLGSLQRQSTKALPSTTVVVVQEAPDRGSVQRGFEVAPSDVVGHQLAQQAKTRQTQTGRRNKYLFSSQSPILRSVAAGVDPESGSSCSSCKLSEKNPTADGIPVAQTALNPVPRTLRQSVHVNTSRRSDDGITRSGLPHAENLH